MKAHKNITISGRVQGVGFRCSAKSVANSMGIKGYVKNIPGDKVYIEAEGTDVQLRLFLQWCYKGPSHARIRDVQITEGKMIDYKHFEIKS